MNNNNLQIIVETSEIFGDIRFTIINNKEYAVGKDIAEALGYADPSSAISKHCKHKVKTTIEAPCQNGNVVKTQTTLIDEGDIYRLIFQASKQSKSEEVKEKAQKFESWIMDEVLPTIRKTVTTLENIEYKGNINNLVYSKDGQAITTSKAISEVTGKEHFHILRDIRQEIEKLNDIHNPNLDSDLIINDFKKVEYIAENGQTYTQYELGEMATMQLMLKYSTEFRAIFIIAFQNMKIAMNNMFKAKVIESVLPQDNRLRQYIYVIKNPLNETVKIGVANDVEKRIKQLQTGAGIELELIYKSMICSNAFNIEKDVHKHFEQYRTFGEWFKINPTEVINFLEQQTFILKSEFMKYLSLAH